MHDRVAYRKEREIEKDIVREITKRKIERQKKNRQRKKRKKET